jgi:hypothetical protein
MKQQTAVQYLFERLFDTPIDKLEWYAILKQAEKMEKEQRNKDYNAGYTDAQCNHINDCENYGNEQDYAR